jgi:hypothetical protein
MLVRDQDPSPSCLGILVSNHRSMTEAMIRELEFLAENPKTRTRLMNLKKQIPVGALVTPNDV